MSEPSIAVQSGRRKLSRIDQGRFLLLLFLLVGGAILRSALATGLDDFTFDEAYHIGAGVSYVQRGDFRINPEHPPLVKLWVGSLMSATSFHLSPMREFHDKGDERDFAEENVFLHNDPNSVQRRSRIAMWTLNGLLLVALAFALCRTFSSVVALGTILFLAIDPTVAAHLPVVMTDLPVAILGAAAVVLATRAFREWLWMDLVACSAALGLALATKHSALVIYVFLGVAGAALAMFVPLSGPADSRLRRFGKLLAVLLGALIVLWSSYFFHFRESSAPRDAFNRPLADKIADVHSTFYRFALSQMAATHAAPRPYIWGLADVVRGAVEGRPKSRLAFGHLYYKKAPKYFFCGVMAVKMPIGLSVLILFGIALFLARRLPRDWILPAAVVLLASLWFLFILSLGSTYAGIRHALPVVVLLGTVGGISAHFAVYSKSKVLKASVALAFLAASASAVPVMRPWEYYNELIGGREKAYLLFNDEGIDLGQRTKEIIRYYHEVLQPLGEVPYVGYSLNPFIEGKARGLDCVGCDPKRDEARLNSPVWSGTILIDAGALGRRLWWDLAPLRRANAVARFGNLLVLRGSFSVPAAAAETEYFWGEEKLYTEKPDLEAAKLFLKQSATLDPTAFFVNIELGNVYLKLGSREKALRAYVAALEHAPDDRGLRQSVQDQIRRVSTQALDKVPTLRNPDLE